MADQRSYRRGIDLIRAMLNEPNEWERFLALEVLAGGTTIHVDRPPVPNPPVPVAFEFYSVHALDREE